MRYDIVITAIRNSRAKPVLAHRMAQDPAMPLPRALASLDALPVTYVRNLPEVEAAQALAHLKRLDVDARLVPREEPSPASRAAPPPVKGDRAPAAQRPPSRISSAFVTAPPPPPSNRPALVAMAITVGVVALAIAGLALFGRTPASHRTHGPSALEVAADVHRAGQPGGGSGASDGKKHAAAQRRASSGGRAPQPDPDKPAKKDKAQSERPTPVQRQQSVQYADSARASAGLPGAIRFYLAAIAFNKRNLDAWQGLVAAYRDAGMSAEAAIAEKEMRRIFGDRSTSLAGAVAPFGQPQDFSYDENGTLRMEYASRATGEEELTLESYRVMRALRTSCECTAISVHARTNAGEDMAVYLNATAFPTSIDEFRSAARITYLK